uniref:Uncharacterized protein n=1 Tax=Oryza barthii TaxID=65489 RepID=A0A0D3HKN4_9ORYZ
MAAGRRGRGDSGAAVGPSTAMATGDGVARSGRPASRSGRGNQRRARWTTAPLGLGGWPVTGFSGVGENWVPFGTGVDSILDVVPLLKASLRRFLLD